MKTLLLHKIRGGYDRWLAPLICTGDFIAAVIRIQVGHKEIEPVNSASDSAITRLYLTTSIKDRLKFNISRLNGFKKFNIFEHHI